MPLGAEEAEVLAGGDRRGRENADKCAGKFGTTHTVENGAKANMRFGFGDSARDYLI